MNQERPGCLFLATCGGMGLIGWLLFGVVLGLSMIPTLLATFVVVFIITVWYNGYKAQNEEE